MDTYQITVRETLEKTVSVEAESPALAVCQVEDSYNAEKIVLSSGNHTGTDIALSVNDKLCREYIENPLFLAFVDARLKKLIPELDNEEKMRLAFGSPDNAISDFESCAGKPDENSICLLYTCDAWHGHGSRELVAPFSSEALVYSYLEKKRKEHNLSDWDLDFFKEQRQTQKQGVNYIMEIVPADIVPE